MVVRWKFFGKFVFYAFKQGGRKRGRKLEEGYSEYTEICWKKLTLGSTGGLNC